MIGSVSKSRRASIRNHPLYDPGVAKVSAFAAALLVISIILTGFIAYTITKEQSVKKLKENDLVFIASSITAKINGSIERAVETARILAEDQHVREWILAGEQQQESISIGKKIAMLKEQFHYDSSFIVTVPQGHYWSESGTQVSTMSESEPNDRWFYRFLQSGKSMEIVIDYNKERKDTFVFVNVLMKDGTNPLAIVGVGLSLKELSGKFEEYKFGKNGSLWLTDSSGTIYLSNKLDQNGNDFKQYLPDKAARQVVAMMDRDNGVMDYKTESGNIHDLILFPVSLTDWKLVVSVDRAEATSFLKTIQAQTATAVVIALFSVVFFFYYTSRKLADPFERAISLNQQLETQIAMRTKELAEQNEKITDSLDYASRIQVSVLPSAAELQQSLPDHFVLWKPRDVVGGDFYWTKPVRDGLLVAVGDCTGHGVPGALMSIMTVSLLDQIVEPNKSFEPGAILSQLNRSIKQTLNQEGKDGLTDDGLEMGLCLIGKEKVVFAGAGMSLYVMTAGGLEEMEGSRKAIGYRKTAADHQFTNMERTIGHGETLYMTTDGLTDQNGGDKNYSFGKKRWKQWLEQNGRIPMPEQRQRLEEELDRYRGAEAQRDDITVIAFKLTRHD